MFKNIYNGVSGYISYRGGASHFAFVMHRVSGVGTLLFLSMHILLESTAHYAPHLYDKLNSGLRSPVALVAEIFMAFLVIFHGVNGTRIAFFDLFRTDKWSLPSGPKSARVTWIISFLLWLPAVTIMLLHGLHIL
jgi:succinate dehydrogenase / fumarate reductase cytochrome b subunit